jgi:transcriptional regulator with XRE-family HTH domain
MKYICSRCKAEIEGDSSPEVKAVIKAIEQLQALGWKDAKIADTIRLDRAALSRWKRGMIEFPDPKKAKKLFALRDKMLGGAK